MLDVNGMRAAYGKVEVLQDVTLNVGEGEIVGLLGRNGVGKSTTLKSILGLVRKTGGQVTFNGEDITGWQPHKIPSCGIGYVPQGRGIFPNLSVEENLYIGLSGPDLPDCLAEIAVHNLRCRQRIHCGGGDCVPARARAGQPDRRGVVPHPVPSTARVWPD